MQFYYNPEVNYLFINHQRGKVEVDYAGTVQFKLPEIGPRPPYYTNPIYEPMMPII